MKDVVSHIPCFVGVEDPYGLHLHFSSVWVNRSTIPICLCYFFAYMFKCFSIYAGMDIQQKQKSYPESKQVFGGEGEPSGVADLLLQFQAAVGPDWPGKFQTAAHWLVSIDCQ